MRRGRRRRRLILLRTRLNYISTLINYECVNSASVDYLPPLVRLVPAAVALVGAGFDAFAAFAFLPPVAAAFFLVSLRENVSVMFLSSILFLA